MKGRRWSRRRETKGEGGSWMIGEDDEEGREAGRMMAVVFCVRGSSQAPTERGKGQGVQ